MNTSQAEHGELSAHARAAAASAELAIAYSKTASDRMDRMEIDFVGHMRKVESKLDQLVDLVRDVAALKQQYAEQSNAVRELRTLIRDQSAMAEDSTAKLSKKVEELVGTLKDSIDAESVNLADRISRSEKNHAILDEKFHKWLNRGIGGWIAFVAVIALLQYTGMKWIDGLERHREAMVENDKKLVSQIEALEARQVHLEAAVKATR